MAATPTRTIARKGNAKAIPIGEAKKIVLEKIAQGYKVAEALATVNRSEETYNSWRKNDAAFKTAVEELRTAMATTKATGRQPVPDFETFCREDLRQPLFAHQLRILDVIEGRAPRDLDPAMTYEAGQVDRLIINVPPDHAKSTTFTVNYVTWCIFKDPDEQIAIICKDQGLAKQFLGAIKQRLTSPLYRDMQMKYGPEGGFKDPDGSWTQDQIFIAGRGTGEKDPTVQAIGIKGRIYGARLSKVICDDLVTGDNVNEYEAQHRKLMQEIETRLPPDGGLLAVLGTRMAPLDLYGFLRDQESFNGVRYWTYFSQPAVLDYGDEDAGPEQWRCLWPETVSFKTGLPEARWDGPNLARKRSGIGERLWALTFQQSNVAVDATFVPEAVEASINRERFPGPMLTDVMGHRANGMDGLYVVGGLDPATVGHTAMIVWGVDRQTQKRYILDGFNKADCSPELMISTIKRLTEVHGINEWVIERNAFQRFLSQLPELKQFLYGRGCKITPHWTQNTNKFDADFGVAAMGPLFLTCGHSQDGGRGGKWKRTPETALIELPNPKQNPWVAELISQLVVWEPQGMSQKQKTDLVMAMWFAEIATQKVLGFGKNRLNHVRNPFLSRARQAQRHVINIADYKEDLLRSKEAG